MACFRQMDLLSHVRSFTQKHSEAVEIKKKKEKKKKEGGGKGKRRGSQGERVRLRLLGSIGICSKAARLRNAVDSFVYKVMSSLHSGVEPGWRGALNYLPVFKRGRGCGETLRKFF